MISAAETLDLEALRSAYPALAQEVAGKRLVYLDSACTALKPKRVADRLADFYANWGGCGGKRSTHLLSQQVEEWFQQSRRAAADFVRADGSNEIVFTSGATEAANLVARSFPYESGAPRGRDHGPRAQRGGPAVLGSGEPRGEIDLKICPTENGRLDLNVLESLLTDRTALLAITHASNVMGGVVPVAEAAMLARRKGARTFVDDAQYLGTHREDVSTLGADFVAFSGHKLGGPFGIGVLWGRETELNRLGRYKVGGGTIKSMAWDGGEGVPEPVYLDAPMRFEAGVQNFGGALGLHEALKARE